MPLVSVVIPTFNRSGLLMRAVRSVLAQTFQDFEVIVVDDGSTDDTETVLGKLDNRRIIYLRNDSNEGAQASRLRGAEHARGDYIAFLDSDDEWYSDKLEKQVKAFEGLPDTVGVVHGDCDVYFEATGEKRPFKLPKLSGNVYSDVLSNPGPLFQCLMVRRGCFEETPDAIDPDVSSWQEWDTSINLARKYEFYFIDESLMLYHRHQGDTISYDLSRDLEGYLYIVEKHKDEMLKRCGRESLGNHYGILARKCLGLKDNGRAREFFRRAREYGVNDLFTRVASFSPGLAVRLQSFCRYARGVLGIVFSLPGRIMRLVVRLRQHPDKKASGKGI